MIQKLIFLAICILAGFWLPAQQAESWLQGSVSFVSSRNVYVKFPNTSGISTGDTLYTVLAAERTAALKIENKSSTSTVCVPLSDHTFKVGDLLFARIVAAPAPIADSPVVKPSPQPPTPAAANIVLPDEDTVGLPLYKEKIRARISVASYSNFSDYRDLHRMRYAFNFTGEHINGSKFSVDNYITYRHTLGDTAGAPHNSFAQALKVYGLSVRYDLDSTASLSFGRRINPRMSNLGAVDGLQFEKQLGRLYVGGILGSRPDFADYSLNVNLLQGGAFVGIRSGTARQSHHTTVGIVEQFNHFKEDRRFVYVQHSSQPTKNISLFSSAELDLYQNILEVKSNTFKLTNLFASVRYRLSSKLQLSASFDSRRNIIYYETYKNQIEQLIEDESRQGLRLGFNYAPIKNVSIGANSSWRFQQSGANQSANYNGYINIAKIGNLKIRTSVTANLLETAYLKSKMLGIRLSHQLIRNKLDAEAYFRRIDYQFGSNSNTVSQHIGGGSLSFTLAKNMNLFIYYEGIFADDPSQQVNRINTRLMYRF
jgi:hypothetical protein